MFGYSSLFRHIKQDNDKSEKKRFGIRYTVTEYVFGEKRYLFTLSDYDWTVYLLPKRGQQVEIVCHLPVVIKREEYRKQLEHIPTGIKGWLSKQWQKTLVWLANKQSRYVFNGVSPIHTEKIKERVVTDALVNGKLSDVFIESRLFVFFGMCIVWRNRFLHKKALDVKALHSTSKQNKRKDTVELVDMLPPAQTQQNFKDYL